MSKSTMITIPTTDGEMRGYLASPASPSLGAVVVLQEIFGVNANIRSIADGYATRGFTALAPDLFWRLRPGVDLDPSDPASRETAMGLMKDFDMNLGVRDVLDAVGHLRDVVGIDGKVGVVGYCLGGKLAYLLSLEPAVDAAVSYYGTGIHNDLDRADEVSSPLLLHVAQEDALCPPEAQAAIRAAFVDLEPVEVAEYPGVGHAFARRGALSCDEQAADRADERTAAFLARHLAGNPAR